LRNLPRVLAVGAGLAVSMLLLASCAGIEEPVVTISGVDFHGLSSEGLEFKLLADVENPNAFGADVSDLEYRISLDDVMVAKGTQADIVHVDAHSTSEVEIPFTFVWDAADEGVLKVLDGRKHDWRIKGSVRLSKSALSRKFNFSESGSFNAPKASDIDFKL
jgi:LEA14-like dessication related protein